MVETCLEIANYWQQNLFVRLLQLSVVRSDRSLIPNCTAEVDTLHIVNGVRMRTKSRQTWVLFAASIAIEVM